MSCRGPGCCRGTRDRAGLGGGRGCRLGRTRACGSSPSRSCLRPWRRFGLGGRRGRPSWSGSCFGRWFGRWSCSRGRRRLGCWSGGRIRRRVARPCRWGGGGLDRGLFGYDLLTVVSHRLSLASLSRRVWLGRIATLLPAGTPSALERSWCRLVDYRLRKPWSSRVGRYSKGSDSFVPSYPSTTQRSLAARRAIGSGCSLSRGR